jgi:hypothetical protein
VIAANHGEQRTSVGLIEPVDEISDSFAIPLRLANRARI